MKKQIRFFAWVLAVLMLLSLAVTGCEKTPAEEQPGTTDSSAITEAPATPGTMQLFKDGIAQVQVVRNDRADSADAAVTQAVQIRRTLANIGSGAEVNLTTDWVKPGEEHDAETLEILVGDTNYAETAQVAAETKYGDYSIRVIGNKIVVFSHTDTGLVKATDVFLNLLLTQGEKSGDGEKISFSVATENLEKTGTFDKLASSMPIFENASFNCVYDAGDSCTELIFEETTTEAYNAYVEKLKAENGYREYTRNEVANNVFTTLYNDTYTMQIGYYNYNQNVRMILEPYSDKTLIGLEADNKFTQVTTSQLTMLGLDYKTTNDDGTTSGHGNGMCIIIRLCDGRFIVIDGGFNTANHYNNFKKVLKDQAKEYDPEGKNITIACWMITHSHGDHQGLIQGKYNNLKSDGIKVENFLVNFMSDSERQKSISSNEKDEGGTVISNNWSSGEGGGWPKVYTAAETLGANMLIAHVGQIYYFADWKCEILFTVESYAPKTVNALNATSVITKMTNTDPKTGKQTVYMSTGDATGTDFQIAANTFGDYMKSDIVQIAHHGYTTWHNDTGTKNGYKKIAPATLIWPQGTSAYPNYVNKGYNKAAWDTTSNPNYKETFVAGNLYDITVLTFPYTVGTGVTTRAN